MHVLMIMFIPIMKILILKQIFDVCHALTHLVFFMCIVNCLIYVKPFVFKSTHVILCVYDVYHLEPHFKKRFNEQISFMLSKTCLNMHLMLEMMCTLFFCFFILKNI
jgi:hypothetical protein